MLFQRSEEAVRVERMWVAAWGREFVTEDFTKDVTSQTQERWSWAGEDEDGGRTQRQRESTICAKA